MNPVNFLSDEFLREQGRKVRIFREMVLVLMVILAMAGWSLTELRRTQKLNRQIVAKKQEVSDIQMQMTQVQQLTERCNNLKRQTRRQAELGLPVEFSQVIATIGAQMPVSLTITELAMETPRPKPKIKKKIDPNKAASTKKPAAKYVPQYIKIVLVGISPTDLDVATFVDRLTTHRLFSTVKVPFSRSTRIGSAAGRKFRVELEVPLDRIYVPSRTADDGKPREEIAHAG